MDFADTSVAPPGIRLSRVSLSIGTLDLLRFHNYEHAFPRHAHEHYTVGVFERDNGTLWYRGATWRAADGTVLAVPPDEVHAAEPARGAGWTYRAFYPSLELVETGLGVRGDATRALFPAPVLHDARLASSLLALHHDLLSGVESLDAEERLVVALRALIARHAVERPWPTRAAPPMAARAVEHARAYLDAHFAEPVKLARLASECRLSAFHLIRSFRAIVGLPPHAYLTQVRANRARDLLLRGESPSAAAYRCGFCDQSHLTRTFKRIFGLTPGAYIEGLRPKGATAN